MQLSQREAGFTSEYKHKLSGVNSYYLVLVLQLSISKVPLVTTLNYLTCQKKLAFEAKLYYRNDTRLCPHLREAGPRDYVAVV